MKETPLIDENLLKLLVCPKSGAKLELKSNKLVCKGLTSVYIVQDGVPMMLAPNPHSEK
jgi:uncharacterized protein YbaR (Trm112 family)